MGQPLDVEIFAIIFNKFKITEGLQLRLVCKKWQDMIVYTYKFTPFIITKSGLPLTQHFKNLTFTLHCDDITNVSALGSVHTLILLFCSGIKDVSALGSVNSLTIAACKNIIDISTLKSAHTLTLRHCSGIKDVSALGSVNTLTLWGCPNIKDVSAYHEVDLVNI